MGTDSGTLIFTVGVIGSRTEVDWNDVDVGAEVVVNACVNVWSFWDIDETSWSTSIFEFVIGFDTTNAYVLGGKSLIVICSNWAIGIFRREAENNSSSSSIVVVRW